MPVHSIAAIIKNVTKYFSRRRPGGKRHRVVQQAFGWRLMCIHVPMIGDKTYAPLTASTYSRGGWKMKMLSSSGSFSNSAADSCCITCSTMLLLWEIDRLILPCSFQTTCLFCLHVTYGTHVFSWQLANIVTISYIMLPNFSRYSGFILRSMFVFQQPK